MQANAMKMNKENIKPNAMEMNLEFIKSTNQATAVEKLLLVLGFQSRLIGTNYLAEAITIKYFDERLSCSNIYKQIAAKYGTTYASVERAIRHSLGNCRNEGCIKDFNALIGCNAIDRKFDTTNSEFISLASKWLHWVGAANADR